jgi:ABC-type dipeptide/oligopeptide/nickel transport system permease subunit
MAVGPSTTVVPAPLEAPAAPDLTGAGWRRLGRLKWGVGGAVIFVLIVLSALLAPVISPHDPLSVDIRHRMTPPAWMEGGTREHLLGTDQIGRDLLSRVIWGGRVSLVVGVMACCCPRPSACSSGWPRATSRARWTGCIMTLINVMLTFPFRAARPRRHRRARPERAQHDHGARE